MGINLKTTISLAALAAASLWLLPAHFDAARAEGADMTVSISKLDITHGQGVEPIDQMDLILNFNNTESSETGKCEATTDSPINGFTLDVAEGACGGVAAATVTVPKLSKIGTSKYKFEGVTKEGATVDATLTKLRTPAGSCGKWHLVLDATPLDLTAVQTNPVATTITLNEGSNGCLSANAAIDR
jgi:hypothetical protein